MTTNKYIVLSDSEAARTKRFRVVQGGYKVSKFRRQQINETIEGGLDVSQGSNYESHRYVIRVRAQEDESDYGTKDDLDYFYSLNDPDPSSGSPGDLINLTDHFGNAKQGYFTGEFAPEPTTTIIEGLYAWFLIPIELRILPS